nr:hypothetical protein [Tanacetum cinerariifolium]
MNLLKSYGYMDPMLILIQIPHLLHLEGNFFESRGCLLLVCRDDIGSYEFTIYEMMIGSSVWTVRYHVDIDDFMIPLLEVLFSSELKSSYHCKIPDGIVAFIAFVELDPCLPTKLFFAWVDLDPGLLLEAFFCSQVELELQVSLELDFKVSSEARETDKLAALTKGLVETQASIHEKEDHVAKMDLND